MASFHNWTGDELIDTQVPQFLNEDNAATQEKLDTKLGKNETAARATQDGAGNTISTTYAKKTDISGMVKSVNGKEPDASGNVNVEKYTHPNSGVTAGTYRSVTVNVQGHVTAGSNPTLAIANGGTGATTAKQARANLEVEPIGTIFAFAGNNIPTGYLPCNGSAISRTTYADLFAVIGTTYGAGDGSTTFNLPNLTDKFIQGSNTAGTVKSAGLPNITSRITAGAFEGYTLALSSMSSNGIQKGALKFSDFTAWAESGWSEKALYAKVLDFNASWSNSIYGNSTTVQPPALTMRYIIKY